MQERKSAKENLKSTGRGGNKNVLSQAKAERLPRMRWKFAHRCKKREKPPAEKAAKKKINGLAYGGKSTGERASKPAFLKKGSGEGQPVRA